jgi:nitrate reductase / nitrite oxidoreductase, alpha subunit
MIGTAFFYLATDQWRYDTADNAHLASPLGDGRFAGRTPADLIATSAQLGWMPSYPTFDRNPLDLADEARERGLEPAEHAVREVERGALGFS